MLKKAPSVLGNGQGVEIVSCRDFCSPLLAYEAKRLINRPLQTYCSAETTIVNFWEMGKVEGSTGEVRLVGSQYCLGTLEDEFNDRWQTIKECSSSTRYTLSVEAVFRKKRRVYFALRSATNSTQCIGKYHGSHGPTTTNISLPLQG